MPIKEAGYYVTQTGVTSATAAADRTILLIPRKSALITLALTSGTPATGARVQYTTSPEADIVAGTAVWVNSPNGFTLVNRGEVNPGEGITMTGVRADVTDGTWTLQIRQA